MMFFKLLNRARICKCLRRNTGIDSAWMEIDSWAPEKVYKYGLWNFLWDRDDFLDFLLEHEFVARLALAVLQYLPC